MVEIHGAAPRLMAEDAWCTMADVDAAGIIYFASAFRWAERLSTTWFRNIEHPYSRLFTEGIATPAVNAQADYKSHIKLDDHLRLELSTAHIGTSSYTLRCEAFVADSTTHAVETRITHVYTRFSRPTHGDAEGQTLAEALPDWLREGLQSGLR